MTSQLMEYFTPKNLFCLQQFGFRPGHSTELDALKLVNHAIAEMNNFNIPTNIYIELSKAFDTLNFDILLKKLDYYGVQGCANRLIYSYLFDRYFDLSMSHSITVFFIRFFYTSSVFN